jgi:hypothetical protein
MTNQQKMQVAALYAKEKDLKVVTKKTGLPEDEVRTFLISRGKTELESQTPDSEVKTWKTMTEEERSVVIEEYNNGSSTYALADKYSIDRVTLTTWLKRHGVVLRGRGPAKKPKPAEEDTRNPAKVHDLVKKPKPEPVKEEAPEQKSEENKPVTVTLPYPLPVHTQTAATIQPVISGKSDKETLADINQALRSLADAYDGLNSKQQIWFDVGESYGRLCCLADELEMRINREHPDDND